MDIANQGDIVQTRWRYEDYVDEPYDIIYSNQDYGYVNAKQRPVLILGVSLNDVIAVPLKTKTHPNGNLKYGAKKAIENGMMYEPSEHASSIAGMNHAGGTFIDLSEVRKIPFKEFTFRNLKSKNKDNFKYPQTTVNEVCEIIGINSQSNMSDIKSVPLNQNPRISKEDLQVKFEAAANAVNKFTKKKNKKAAEAAKATLKSLKTEKKNCFTPTDSEKEEHQTARKLGLTRDEMAIQTLSAGLEELNAQDDLSL